MDSEIQDLNIEKGVLQSKVDELTKLLRQSDDIDGRLE
jgi:hypothetical protein